MAEVVVGSKFGEQGRYEIVESLGHGGMADVYLARDHGLHREIAVKFIAEQLTRQRDFLQKAQEMAKA